MKIAHLTTVDLSLRYLLLPQLEAARDLGESVGISAPGPYVAELESRGIRHVALPSSTRGMDLLADLKAAGQLWRVLRAERPDVLHTHNPKPGVYGRILGRLAGVPIVINTIHGLYATPDSSLIKRAIVYFLEAMASRFSDAELVQNPEDLDLLRRSRIAPRRKLRLLGNGVDLVRFNPRRAEESRKARREELGLQPDEVVVGFVGRLVAEKGIPELIDMAEALEGRVRCVFVGPGDPDKADSLSNALIDRGKEAGALFLGMRPDVDELYGAFDIFVLPSHREGYPRAAMEAAASGLPIVATDIRGSRQVVRDGVNGLLFPVGDREALRAAVEALALDADLRKRLGSASAKKAIEEFDESKVVEIVMDTYREVASAKGLDWKLAETGDVEIREAVVGDASSVAELHKRMIATGFLASLGVGFLRVLYETLIESDSGRVFVAVRSGSVIAFIAGSEDTGAFYGHFIRRRFLSAATRVIPSLLRVSTWKMVYETLRYGTGSASAGAELLSMAVAPSARRRGVGEALVKRLLVDAAARGVGTMKVVVGKDNAGAISLYEKCGFGEARSFEMHAGAQSLELTWSG